MSAAKISANQAFQSGADLWIIQNDPNLYWWKKLDLHSRYLLSQNILKPHKETPVQIQNIITATDMDVWKNEYTKNSLLLGTEDHFLNKWLLLWDSFNDAQLLTLVEMAQTQLHAASIRFFSHSHIAEKILTRPMASSVSISYIENC